MMTSVMTDDPSLIFFSNNSKNFFGGAASAFFIFVKTQGYGMARGKIILKISTFFCKLNEELSRAGKLKVNVTPQRCVCFLFFFSFEFPTLKSSLFEILKRETISNLFLFSILSYITLHSTFELRIIF